MTKLKVLADLNIPYIIRKESRRSLTIRFDEYGNLLIKQPKFISNLKLEEYISLKIDWILKNKRVNNLSHYEYHDNDNYLLLGKTITIKLCQNKHESVNLIDNYLYIYYKDLSNINNLLDKYRYKIAEDTFNELLYDCFKEMESYLTKYPNLIIKKSKTKWGYCRYLQNEVMLNVSLIHTDIELIRYVIIHELSHFVYPNHSKMFHAFVRKFCPNELTYRKKLKNYSPNYK